jgi:hypothetical protein
MVLEYFAVSHLANNMNQVSKKEDKHLTEIIVTNGLSNNNSLNIDALTLVIGLVALLISIYTAKLAYNCNIKATDVSRMVATLFGFFFSGTYLIYYFVWHKVLGNKCY